MRGLGGQIGKDGAQQLAAALVLNSGLTNLNAFGNAFGPLGAGSMAGALLRNSTLRMLNIGGNGLLKGGSKVRSHALPRQRILPARSLRAVARHCSIPAADALIRSWTAQAVGTARRRFTPTTLWRPWT